MAMTRHMMFAVIDIKMLWQLAILGTYVLNSVVFYCALYATVSFPHKSTLRKLKKQYNVLHVFMAFNRR